MTRRSGLEQNLRVIWVHEALASSLPWLPIFVFFIRGKFGIDGALTLTAVYYLAVVVAEVPSGWLSDRLGRVLTLRLAAGAWMLAHATFLLVDSFIGVVLGQVLLAVGFAAISGTNVAFHFDSLEALDRDAEFEPRQARLASVMFLAFAVSNIVGGLLALVRLELAFGLSLFLAFAQLMTTTRMTEPTPDQAEAGEPLVGQLRACRGYLASPFLRWVLLYWIAMVVLEHVAFTLSQPYLTEVLGRSPDDLGNAPFWAGVLFAGFSLGGALAARLSSRFRRRVGFFGALIAVSALSASIVTLMALVVSAVVVVVMLLRSVQAAVSGVLLNAAVAPLIEQRHRATYLSLNSLAGRLAYGALLFGVARAVGDDLGRSLGFLAVISWGLVAIITLGTVLLAMDRTTIARS